MPASAATRGLFVDLAKQENPGWAASDDEVLENLRSNEKYHQGQGNIFYIARTVEDLLAAWERWEKDGTFAITALVTPADVGSTSSNEGKFQWGTYAMPNPKTLLHKRQRFPQEEPMSITDTSNPVQSPKETPVSTFQSNNTTPLRGILPACFTSQSACESATRNCTGHGQCNLKYHDADSLGPRGETGLDCWSCLCTKPTSAAGKKTTIWGGPACQKKDVSVEFWLIALFTVGMIGLVSFAIGTIWEMGSQELPSVIGAGVSGPTARK